MPNSWNHNFLGSNLSSLASLRWIFEPMEADVTDASTMLSIQRLLGDMVVCCMCSHVSRGRLESHHSFHTVKVLQAPAMHAEQNRHTRESWYAGCNGSLKAQSANATCYEDCKLIVWGPGWKVRRGFWGRPEKGFGESSLTKEGVTTGFIGAWKVPKGREGGLKQIWTVSVKDGFKDGCAQTNDNICHPTVQEVNSQV